MLDGHLGQQQARAATRPIAKTDIFRTRRLSVCPPGTRISAHALELFDEVVVKVRNPNIGSIKGHPDGCVRTKLADHCAVADPHLRRTPAASYPHVASVERYTI